MKSHVLSCLAGIFCIVLIWGCEAETVAPRTQNDASGQLLGETAERVVHPTVSGVCADTATWPLVDWNGNAQINYCGAVPCTGSEPGWGKLNAYHTADRMYMEVEMAYGWFVQEVKSYIGDQSNINVVNGIPSLTGSSSWEIETFDAALNRGQVWHSTSTMSNCFGMMIKLDVVKLDFFTGVDAASARELTVWNSKWNDQSLPVNMRTNSGFVCTYCAPPCIASTSLDENGSNF